MPVRNEARFISDTLGQLINQEYPPDRFEIIVADGMSDDGTREIVKRIGLEFPQVRLLDNPKRLSSAGRNVGFRSGRGDLFLVIDGHCFIPDNQLLVNVAECFEKSGADCLGRPQPLDPPGLSMFQRAIALARGSRLGHGGDSLIYGEYEGFASPVSNGAAYRRDLLEKVGFVDEGFDAAEDVEFNYRVEKAGFKAFTSPRLTVRYYPRETISALFRQMNRYGMGRWRFIRKHPEALTLNQLIPAFFVAGFGAVCVTALWSLFQGTWIQVLLVAAPYALYLIAVLFESARLALRNGIKYIPLIPLILLTIHVGLGWGFLRAALTQLRSEA